MWKWNKKAIMLNMKLYLCYRENHWSNQSKRSCRRWSPIVIILNPIQNNYDYRKGSQQISLYFIQQVMMLQHQHHGRCRQYRDTISEPFINPIFVQCFCVHLCDINVSVTLQKHHLSIPAIRSPQIWNVGSPSTGWISHHHGQKLELRRKLDWTWTGTWPTKDVDLGPWTKDQAVSRNNG